MVRIAIALTALMFASPAVANVHEVSDAGFVVREAVDVPVAPDKVWPVLLRPEKWWSKKHSFSGDPANFSLEARAGGCFCEVLRNEISPNAAPRGSVEHMRVIYVEAPRALRMTGALGPLQSGAATGTLTIMLRPQGEGTRILWEYVVGGYLRADPQTLAAAVDTVIAEQARRLGELLGAPAAPMSPRGADGAAGEASGREKTSDADFAHEMAAGIDEAAARERSAQAPAPENSAIPPRKAEQPVFIGR